MSTRSRERRSEPTIIQSILRRAVAARMRATVDGPSSVADFDGALRAATAQRLTGFLLAAADRGELDLTPAQRTQTAAMHRRAVLRVLELERTLIDVAVVLSARGIDFRVLKGPAVARTVYSAPHLRTFVDVDVIVPPLAWPAAVGALAAAGYRRLRPELRDGFDARFAKTITMADASGCQVDLHRTLVVGPYGVFVDAAELCRRARQITIGGVAMRALGPEEQFLNLCYHAALGDAPPRLAVLVDVAVSMLHDDLDAARVRALARRWRGEAVLATAIQLTWEMLEPGTPPPLAVWAQSFVPSRRDRVLLAAYRRRRGNAPLYIATALVLPTTAQRLAYLRGLLWPARHEGAVHGGRVAWWVHGMRRVLHAGWTGRPEAG